MVLTLVVAVGCFGLWSANDAGYEEILWYPVALVLLLLGAVLAWATGIRTVGRWTAFALVSLAAFVAWSYLSIAWAGDRGTALSGANKALLYLIVFAVVATRRWASREALALTAAWATVTVAVGAVVLYRIATSLHPGADFVSGRLSSPVDYANANGALFALAAWPLAVAAQERQLPVVARGLALGLATAATELALLSQSKGAAIGVAATLLVLAAVAPSRARLLLVGTLIAATIAVVHRPLFDVWHALNDGHDVHAAMRSGALAIALSSVAVAVVGTAVAVIDQMTEASLASARTWAGRALVAALAAAALVACTAVVLHYGGPSGAARHAWHAFRHPPTTEASSHFTSTTGNHRYDVWRVAARQFKRAPLTGAGMDNFGADYVRERRTNEQPKYPHSLEARLLGGTGLIGFALFAAFVVAALRLVLRAARSRSALAAPGLAALAMFAYWLAHGSVDWLWEFPGLTGPAFAAAGCACAFETSSLRAPRGILARRTLAASAGVASLVAAVVLAGGWLAARDVAVALSSWRTDLPAAYADLRQAASLNPLSEEPYVVAGTIAERHADWPLAERQFRLALDRNEENWYSHLELAVALSNRGDHRAAERELLRARDLDPLETLITDAIADVRAGRKIDARSLDREIIARTPAGAAR